MDGLSFSHLNKIRKLRSKSTIPTIPSFGEKDAYVSNIGKAQMITPKVSKRTTIGYLSTKPHRLPPMSTKPSHVDPDVAINSVSKAQKPPTMSAKTTLKYLDASINNSSKTPPVFSAKPPGDSSAKGPRRTSTTSKSSGENEDSVSIKTESDTTETIPQRKRPLFGSSIEDMRPKKNYLRQNRMSVGHALRRQTLLTIDSQGSSSTIHVNEAKHPTRHSLGPITILLPKVGRFFQKQRRKEAAKNRMIKNTTGKRTFRNITIENARLIDRINQAFDIDRNTVQKIVVYAKTICAEGSDIVDREIFEAQMLRRFHLSSVKLIDRMYSILCSFDTLDTVYVEEYVELISVFLTKNIDLKVQFVFKVYNTRDNNTLTRVDLEDMLAPVAQCFIDYAEDDDTSYAQALKDLVEMTLFSIDRNGDGAIDLPEFKHLISQKKEMLQLLGPCLPADSYVTEFINILSDRDIFDVNAYFLNERKNSLFSWSRSSGISKETIQTHYSVPLVFP